MTGGGADDTARNCDVIGTSHREILKKVLTLDQVR